MEPLQQQNYDHIIQLIQIDTKFSLKLLFATPGVFLSLGSIDSILQHIKCSVVSDKYRRTETKVPL